MTTNQNSTATTNPNPSPMPNHNPNQMSGLSWISNFVPFDPREFPWRENQKELCLNFICGPAGLTNIIRNRFVFKKIYDIIQKKKKLEIVKYNKKIQNRLNLSIDDYKEYSEKYSSIEIELTPLNSKEWDPINYSYYLCNADNIKIFINNDDKEEKKLDKIFLKNRNNKNEKNKIIKIILNHKVKNLHGIFQNCAEIKTICFNKFYRNNFTDMSKMFSGCSSLKELIIFKFNTDNVTNMSEMFSECISLKEISFFNKINTSNVKNMSNMFYKCSSLEGLNLSDFNTENVIDMSCMFCECSSLQSINLSSFNTKKVTNMNCMFKGCSSLKKLDLSNFDIKKVACAGYMFKGCTSLKKLIFFSFYKKHKKLIYDMLCECEFKKDVLNFLKKFGKI
jgi:surface protein